MTADNDLMETLMIERYGPDIFERLRAGSQEYFDMFFGHAEQIRGDEKNIKGDEKNTKTNGNT